MLKGLYKHPILLGNDSNGIFYLNYISGDTLMLKRQSETTCQSIVVVLKDFDLKNGLQHCIVKNKDRIILLNRSNNSIQCYDCKGNGSITECTKLSDTKVELEKNEKLLRIEKDNLNIYLVSYNFKNRCQKFYLLKPENNATKLLFSNYNPFLEIFFSDPNVSNYSFYNNKLSLTDFYSGNTLIIDLLNSRVDSVKLPGILNEKLPSYGTFERLNNKYDKHSTWANYDSLMNLVRNYNHVINSFFLDDSTILISFYFVDTKLAPFDMIGINVLTKRAIFNQKRIKIKSGSDTVNLMNMPIFIGFEESNFIGDGIIYVYKEMPELNKDDFVGFFNKMNQIGGPNLGMFVLYKKLY